MRNYKVTKKDIIEALETEDLTVGEWFASYDNDDDGICEVCAVGAILRKIRSIHFTREDAEEICEFKYAYHHKPKKANLMSLLSCEYEKAFMFYVLQGDWWENPSEGITPEEGAIEYARAHAINVVLGEFPDELEVVL